MARVSRSANQVVWTDFEQVHRDWNYNLAFTFERQQYESALVELDAAS